MRPEFWLAASACQGLIALAVMAGDLPLLLLLGPVTAQVGSLTVALVALDESPARGGGAS